MAEGRLAQRHRQEWLQLLRQAGEESPELSKHQRRNWALKRLRGAHRLEWAQMMSRAVDLLKEQSGWVDGRIAKRIAAGQRPEYAHRCSYCGSEVNEPCRKPTGAYALSHKARMLALPPAA